MRHLLKVLETEAQIDFSAEALLVGMDVSQVPLWRLEIDASKIAKIPCVLLPAAVFKCVNVTKVLCPLANPGLDVMDIARHLQNLECEGEFIVIAPYLPRPEIVRREILNDAPDIKLTLVASLVH